MSDDRVAWECVAGFNVFWPHGGPVAEKSGRYAIDPYAIGQAGSWRQHITREMIARDRGIGCDHYRHQPSPAPFLEAEACGDSERLANYHVLMDEIVNDTLEEGMGVMWSPFLSQPNIDPAFPLDGVGRPGFEAYASYLVATAARYAACDPRRFALALMNEPPHPKDFHGSWPDMQRELYNRVRDVAPNMTLALTSANYSSLHLLSGGHFSGLVEPSSGMETQAYDRNTLWEFHPMLPAPLVLHGASYHDRYRFVRGISYPPRASERDRALRETMKAIVDDKGLTEARRDELLGPGGLIEELGFFYDLPQDCAWLRLQLSLVMAWARAKDLPTSSLYAGEVGFTRSNSDFASGNDAGTIVRAVRDASHEILRCGFRVAWDHLDTPDYGITDGTGTRIGNHRPDLLLALNLGAFRRQIDRP